MDETNKECDISAEYEDKHFVLKYAETNGSNLQVDTLKVNKALLTALEDAKENFKRIAKINHIVFFEAKPNLFLLSMQATEQQPYGPYSDRMCTPDDLLAIKAKQCYELAKQLKL